MQIIFGILALVVILTLLAAQFEKITHQKKMDIIKTIAAIIALLWLYETFIDSTQKERLALVQEFAKGKILICDGHPVSKKEFYYENGTESFVNNDKNNSLIAIIYPIDECEVKEKE